MSHTPFYLLGSNQGSSKAISHLGKCGSNLGKALIIRINQFHQVSVVMQCVVDVVKRVTVDINYGYPRVTVETKHVRTTWGDL